MDSYIYLASPYTHKDRYVRDVRYEYVNQVAAVLLKRGFHIFSPIVHCHPMAERYDLPKDIDFWHRYDTMMLSKAGCLLVLRLEDWEQSKGLAFEIALAQKLEIPIFFMDPPPFRGRPPAPVPET